MRTSPTNIDCAIQGIGCEIAAALGVRWLGLWSSCEQVGQNKYRVAEIDRTVIVCIDTVEATRCIATSKEV